MPHCLSTPSALQGNILTRLLSRHGRISTTPSLLHATARTRPPGTPPAEWNPVPWGSDQNLVSGHLKRAVPANTLVAGGEKEMVTYSLQPHSRANIENRSHVARCASSLPAAAELPV